MEKERTLLEKMAGLRMEEREKEAERDRNMTDVIELAERMLVLWEMEG